jgi:hypothetical protein
MRQVTDGVPAVRRRLLGYQLYHRLRAHTAMEHGTASVWLGHYLDATRF